MVAYCSVYVPNIVFWYPRIVFNLMYIGILPALQHSFKVAGKVVTGILWKTWEAGESE